MARRSPERAEVSGLAARRGCYRNGRAQIRRRATGQVQPGEELTPGRLQISARAEEVGDNQGEIDAAVEGDSSKIAFNSKYLQDVLNVLSDGKVALETQGPSQPGVIRPIGSDNYVHVVIPMFVQW